MFTETSVFPNYGFSFTTINWRATESIWPMPRLLLKWPLVVALQLPFMRENGCLMSEYASKNNTKTVKKRLATFSFLPRVDKKFRSRKLRRLVISPVQHLFIGKAAAVILL